MGAVRNVENSPAPVRILLEVSLLVGVGMGGAGGGGLINYRPELNIRAQIKLYVPIVCLSRNLTNITSIYICSQISVGKFEAVGVQLIPILTGFLGVRISAHFAVRGLHVKRKPKCSHFPRANSLFVFLGQNIFLNTSFSSLACEPTTMKIKCSRKY